MAVVIDVGKSRVPDQNGVSQSMIYSRDTPLWSESLDIFEGDKKADQKNPNQNDACSFRMGSGVEGGGKKELCTRRQL